MSSLALIFPGFYALTAAWLFLLFIPLIIFYFLKLKRARQMVPSLLLWRQVLQDQRVNSPFQKFKRNILLLLQALLLLLLCLAAMQPFWRGQPNRAQRLPVLIDCSASMAALDAPGGQTRLDAAREQVRKMIDGLLPDQELSLIPFARTARKLTPFTNNKRELHAALDQIAVQDVASDLEDALRLTQALSRTTAFDKAVLISDGNLPAQSDLELPFALDYQKLPPAGPNFGITALSARRAGAGEWDLFVKIEASKDAESPATVEVYQDEDKQPLAVEQITIPKGGAQRLVFRVPVAKPTSFRVVLTPDNFDALKSDNQAFIDLSPARPLYAYVPPALANYRQALRAVPGVRVFPEAGAAEGATPAEFDLLITDQKEDLARPATTRLVVGLLPPDVQEKNLLAVSSDGSTAIDWQKGSALLQHVELADVIILDKIRYSAGVKEENFESLGYEVLVHGPDGPLVLSKQEGPKVAYYLLFHTDRSTLSWRVGFPIMVWNVANLAMQQAGLLEAQGPRTGVLPALDLSRPNAPAGNKTYHVQGPLGPPTEEHTDARGLLTGVAAPHIGRYLVKDGSATKAGVGVSLLDPRESTLATTDRIQFKEVSVAATVGPAKVDKPLWPYLAALALAVLLLEWWFYQKRALPRAAR